MMVSFLRFNGLFLFRPQLKQRLESLGIPSQFHDERRITDAQTLECVKDTAGYLRVQLESRLGRGVVNSPGSHKSRVNVTSGNFVSASPAGLHRGVDLQHTGEVRNINTRKLRALLDEGDVALLSCVGFDAGGKPQP